MTTDQPTDSRRVLVVAPGYIRTGGRDDGQVFWNPESGHEIRLGNALAELAARFAMPSSVDVVVAAIPGAARESARNAVTALEEAGLLVGYRTAAAAAPAPAPAATGTGLFGAPVLDAPTALTGDTTDVVVIGMPYDVGSTHRPGSRFAPDELRQISTALFQYRCDAGGRPRGLHDPLRGRAVLDGVRIADLANISQPVHTRNGDSLEGLHRLARSAFQAGRFVLTLGGDHSISLPLITAALDVHGRIGVLHVDAHSDFAAPRTDDWRRDCHHGNFMSWVVGDARLGVLAQFGVRQLTEYEIERPEHVRVWPGRTAVLTDPDSVLAELPEDIPYYLTIDADGLDPSALPDTGTPLPGGFGHAELVTLLEHLAVHRRLIGMDFVELIPGDRETSTLTAADLILRVLDAATASDKGERG